MLVTNQSNEKLTKGTDKITPSQSNSYKVEIEAFKKYVEGKN